ncbi:MAG: CBS domain-containing protein [Desulfobacteraceae bacterium]|nr:CBS domain-containing protein [Desulfobacteraceae bacterium]
MKNAEDILNDKQKGMVTVSSGHTVLDAIRIMNAANIGAILVEEKGEIAGIWTERDLLHHVGEPEFDPATAKIGDHMNRKIHKAPGDTPLIKLEEMLLGLFVRHILIEKDNRNIGLLSIGDVLRASLLEKDLTIKELNSIASWEYYENWGWGRKQTKKPQA